MVERVKRRRPSYQDVQISLVNLSRGKLMLAVRVTNVHTLPHKKLMSRAEFRGFHFSL